MYSDKYRKAAHMMQLHIKKLFVFTTGFLFSLLTGSCYILGTMVKIRTATHPQEQKVVQTFKTAV